MNVRSKRKNSCVHCKERGHQNTNRFYKAFKKSDKKDNTSREGGRTSPKGKKTSPKGGRREWARSFQTSKEEAESETDSDTGALVLSRAKWLPEYFTESDSDSEPESEYSPEDVSFISSDIDRTRS